MMIGQLFTTNLFSMQVTAATKNVLWSGNASVSGEWSTWSSATSYNVTDSSIFSSPFELQVSYKSTSAPILVFQSWSGGEPWVQLNAFYAADGVAYYPYDSIINALGYDSSLINCIAIYPNGADLTATELALCPASATEDVSIHYNGLAGTLVDEMGAGWNLGNTLDSCGDWITQYGDGSTESFETAWGNLHRK